MKDENYEDSEQLNNESLSVWIMDSHGGLPKPTDSGDGKSGYEQYWRSTNKYCRLWEFMVICYQE